ncbi:MAG TPA: hypothetical protein DEB71_04060 [Chryseobacterium carnipullorum]|nr:hypothetical protein [Chryseobacterium carnipullorum]
MHSIGNTIFLRRAKVINFIKKENAKSSPLSIIQLFGIQKRCADRNPGFYRNEVNESLIYS